MAPRAFRGVLALVLCCVGCGRSSASTSTDRASPGSGAGDGDAGSRLLEMAGDPTARVVVEPPPTALPTPSAPSRCGGPPPASGILEIASGGAFGARTVWVDYPSKVDVTTPMPLILAFHGWGGDPEQLERTTSIVAAATARGFVVARATGVGKTKSFNAGTCCGEASEQNVDDVALSRAIVERIGNEACLDRTRVYATGFSNGGFLSHRLACEAADVFVAIASVSGTFGIERCAPSRPVSVLHIHGRRDGIVRFGGDVERGWSSVATTIDAWVRADRCALDSAQEVYHHGGARCVRSGACAGGTEVTLCRDDRAGHTWPGGPKSTGFGGSQDLDATRTILDFFARSHRAP